MLNYYNIFLITVIYTITYINKSRGYMGVRGGLFWNFTAAVVVQKKILYNQGSGICAQGQKPLYFDDLPNGLMGCLSHK